MQTSAATMETTEPKVFTLGAAVMVNAYGLLLVAPLFAAMVVVSLMKFSALTVLVPLAVVAGTAYLLPFGGGNTYVRRLVHSLVGAAEGKGAEGFVVQLTLSPRLRSGVRAVLEDADDIGRLTLEEDGARFAGDAVKVFVPYDRIEDVRAENSGLRGGFVYGRRIRVVACGLPQTGWLEFMERGSLLLPESRRITRELHAGLLSRVAASAGGRAGTGADGMEPTPVARP